MTVPEAVRLRHALVDRLDLGSACRDAVESVARGRSLGSAIAEAAGRRDEWRELAYRDETWVAQIVGNLVEDARGTVSGTPTSPSMLPSLVVRMLEIAQIFKGDRVLEISTGTGYSTALMCHRLSSEAVTSVKYDPVVADRARDALTGAGYAPTLVIDDGGEATRRTPSATG